MAPSIFIVDDEPDILELLVTLVRVSGRFDVEGFGAPAEALRRANEQPPNLILTDYQMPGMNGVELSRAIKTTHPKVKCVLITAYADSSTGRPALAEGAIDDFCRKSIAPPDLLALIQKQLS